MVVCERRGVPGLQEHLVDLGEFDLAAAVGAARRARHQLHVVVVALALLDLSHDVLDVSETIGLGKLEECYAFGAVGGLRSENDLLEVLVLSLDVFKRLVISYELYLARVEELPLCPPEDVFEVAIGLPVEHSRSLSLKS